MSDSTLFLTLEYPPQVGGIGNYYWQLIQHLPSNEIRLIDNQNNRLVSPWLKTWRVLRQQQHQQPFSRIIVGHILPLGTVVAVWHWLFATPYLVFVHGMDITVPQRYWRKRLLLHWILRQAHSIVTVSAYSRDHIQHLLPQQQWKKIHVLKPGPYITPNQTAEPVAIALPPTYLLSVGRLVERKGFDMVIRALHELADSQPQLHYVIAGDGPDQARLEQLIDQYQLGARVHLLGRVSNGQLATLYQQCQFLLLPSRHLVDGDFEGFGIVIVEANIFGKPAIAGMNSGSSSAIIPGQTGLLVDGSDLKQLTEAIRRLIEQPIFCQQLGKQAQEHVQQHYDWSTIAQQFRALLASM